MTTQKANKGNTPSKARELKGNPEVTKSSITPKGTGSAQKKLVKGSTTPFDKAAMVLVLSHVSVSAVSTAVGAWHVWGDDWFNIAHFYWPFGIATATTAGLVFHYFSRE